MSERVREVETVVESRETMEGAGVRLSRSLGGPALRTLDPFLLLDEFKSDDPDDYIAGFPWHPHRGMETVTYMLAGAIKHEDSLGHAGTIGPGGVQWMTAGRGIVHQEMPARQDGLLWGFQLWLNLAAADKMNPPRYQEFEPAVVPEYRTDTGAVVRVIAGEVGGVRGPIRDIAIAPTYLDVQLPAGARFELPVPAAHTAWAYVFDGAVELGDPTGAPGSLDASRLAVLGAGGRICAGGGPDGGRFLCLTGRPIEEPVVWYGPFVMNTQAEIDQAILDHQAGRLGQE